MYKRQVAASYSNELPVYVPDSGHLLKGDRVRITSGPFADMEAEVVVQPGGGHKDCLLYTSYRYDQLRRCLGDRIKPYGPDPV